MIVNEKIWDAHPNYPLAYDETSGCNHTYEALSKGNTKVFCIQCLEKVKFDLGKLTFSCKKCGDHNSMKIGLTYNWNHNQFIHEGGRYAKVLYTVTGIPYGPAPSIDHYGIAGRQKSKVESFFERIFG